MLRVSRPGIVALERPGCIGFSITDRPIRIGETIRHHVDMRAPNVDSQKIPASKITSFTDCFEHNPRPKQVQLIGLLSDSSSVIEELWPRALIGAAMAASRSIHPSAIVSWEVCCVAVESQEVGHP